MKILKNIIFFVSIIFLIQIVFSEPSIVSYEVVERTENTLSFNLTFSEEVTIKYYHSENRNIETHNTLTDNYILKYDDLEKNTEYTFTIEITNSTGASIIEEIIYKTDIYDISQLEGHIFESNQNYTISQDQTGITSLNLQNIENTTISCDGYKISSDVYNFSNTKNVTFNSCIVDFPSDQVIFEDTLDTYIKFETDSYDAHLATFNFSKTTGKYFIDKKLNSFTLTRSNDGSQINNYDLNVSSRESFYILNTYEYTQDDEIYYLYQNFSNAQNTTYDTIVFDVSSIETGSSNSVSLSEEEVEENGVEMQLEDIQSPYLIDENFILRTNDTLNFNLTFSENISYIYSLEDEDENILKQIFSDEKSLYHNIIEENLEPDKIYVFKFEIEDLLGYKNTFTLEYRTDIYQIDSLINHIFESNQNYTISSYVTKYDFNLTDRENISIKCDDNIIDITNFYVENSKNILFDKCIFSFDGSGTSQSSIGIYDNENTNIIFMIQDRTDIILDFLLGVGTYEINDYIDITVSADVFDLNLSSYLGFDKYNTYTFNQGDEFYYLYENFSNSQSTSYDALEYSIYSPQTLSSYTNTEYFENLQDPLQITLEDKSIPEINFEESSFQVTNSSIEIDLKFNKNVLESSFYNFSNGENNIFGSKGTTFTKEFTDLENNTFYEINITLFDESSNTNFYTLTFETFENFEEEDEFSFKNIYENATNLYYKFFDDEIEINFLDSFNLYKTNNLQNIFDFQNETLFLDTIDKNITLNITYPIDSEDFTNKPILFENGSIYDSDKIIYENFTNNNFYLTLNDTINKSFSLEKNSYIKMDFSTFYIKDGINLNVSLRNVLNEDLINSSCSVGYYLSSLDSSYSITLSSDDLFTHNFSFEENDLEAKEYVFETSCNSNDDAFEDFESAQNITFLSEEIDDFSITLELIEDQGVDITSIKQINMSIDDNSSSFNTNSQTSNYYSFFLLKDTSYVNPDWEDYKISEQYNIGKNKFIEFYFDEDLDEMYYILENGSTYTMNESIFITKKDDEFITLRLVVLNCVDTSVCNLDGENFKANQSQTYSFFDETKPKIKTDIKEFYNSDEVEFTYNIYDLESEINEDKVSFFLEDNETSNGLFLSGFFQNENLTYNIGKDYFENRKRYNFTAIFENTLNLEETKSFEFLIDDDVPQNISIYEKENRSHINTTFVTFNLTAEDYNNGTEFEYSGLDYMEIFMTNSSIDSYGNCGGVLWGDILNFTLSENNKTLELELNDSICYGITYIVYDKAGNFNMVNLPENLIVDLTEPEVNLVNGEYIIISKNSIYKDSTNLEDGDTTIFSLEYDFSDDISGIELVEIEMYNGSGSSLDELITTFFTDNPNSYEVKYNSSIISESEKYFFKIRAKNKAEIYTPFYTETNGVIFEILNVPNINFQNELEEEYFVYKNNEEFNLLSFFESSTNQTSVMITTNQIESSCLWDELDLDYNSMNPLNVCSTTDNLNHKCDISIEYNNIEEFSISCRSLDDNSINSEENNLDFIIEKIYDYNPEIEDENYYLSLNQILEDEITYTHNNSESNIYVNSLVRINDDLSFEINHSTKEDIEIHFLNDSYEDSFFTEREYQSGNGKELYTFYFYLNESASIEELENLYNSYNFEDEFDKKLNFIYTDKSSLINNDTSIQVNYNSDFLLDNSFFQKSYGGISNKLYVVNHNSNYDFLFDYNENENPTFTFNSSGLGAGEYIIPINYTDDFVNYFEKDLSFTITEFVRDPPTLNISNIEELNNSEISNESYKIINISTLFESNYSEDLIYSYSDNDNLIINDTNLEGGLIDLKIDNSSKNSTINFEATLDSSKVSTGEINFIFTEVISNDDSGDDNDGGGGGGSGGGGSGSSGGGSSSSSSSGGGGSLITPNEVIPEKTNSEYLNEFEKQEFTYDNDFTMEKNKRITFNKLNFDYSFVLKEIYEDYSVFEMNFGKRKTIFYNENTSVDFDGDNRNDFSVLIKNSDNNLKTLTLNLVQIEDNILNTNDNEDKKEDDTIKEEIRNDFDSSNNEENSQEEKEEDNQGIILGLGIFELIALGIIPVLILTSTIFVIRHIKQKNSVLETVKKEELEMISIKDIQNFDYIKYFENIIKNSGKTVEDFDENISKLKSEFNSYLEKGYSWGQIFSSLDNYEMRDFFFI